MTVVAGQPADKSGHLRCEACHERTRVEKGEFIQTCPNCGNNTFSEGKKK